MANLAGGAGADSFVIANAGSIGSIDGGGGSNTLDLSGRASGDFNLTGATAGTASGITGAYSNVATLKGNGTTSTLTGSATGSTFTASAANAGTVNDGVGTTNFSGVPNLAGGAGNDSFAIGAGVALGSIDGGGGVNSLSASANGAENLTLANALLTRNVTGNVTLANITSASLNGSAANNTIDASAWTGGRTVAVNVSAGTDSIIGNGVGHDAAWRQTTRGLRSITVQQPRRRQHRHDDLQARSATSPAAPVSTPITVAGAGTPSAATSPEPAATTRST